MSYWRQITRGLRTLMNPQAADREVADEVRHFYAEAEGELRERGMSLSEARRTTRLELGDADLTRERVRSYGWENLLTTAGSDLSFGWRQLRRNPGFTIVAVLTLALGIGASTIIFSAVDPVLLRPLPYPGASRLMMIWERNSSGGRRYVTFGAFRGVQDRTHSFDALAVMKTWQPSMTGEAQPERFEGQRVSADYFRVFGIAPLVGRDFQTADDVYRGPNVVILSNTLWLRRFSGDRGIIGRQITLDGNGFTVIGVMPPNYDDVLAPDAQLWAPLQYNPALPIDGREWGHHLRMVGRLRSGISSAQAASELGVILSDLAKTYRQGFDAGGGVAAGFLVNPLQSDLTADVKPALIAIACAVLLLLLIAAVNVTSLLLARSANRSGEFAMRVALGAGRSRLVRQLVTECLLLTTVGGTLALVIAAFGVRTVVALSPPDLPRLNAIRVDGFVLAFGVALTIVVGLVLSIAPALQASREDLRSGMQGSSRRITGGRHSARKVLVVTEVALALVLLIGAGLLLHSVTRLFSTDPGFDASNVLSLQVQTAGGRFNNGETRALFFDDALARVRQLPGVQSAAFTSQLPLSGDNDQYGVQFSNDQSSTGSSAFRYAVSPGYFDTMHIALKRGRLLNEGDRAGTQMAVVINESFAKRTFGDKDPIGQGVHVAGDIGHAERPWGIVVGVVADVKQSSLAVGEEDAFYVTPEQWLSTQKWSDNVVSFVARAKGDAGSLTSAVKNAVWSVDKDQPIVRVETMEAVLARSEAQRHFALVLFESFALIALVLAAAGIYGVLSGSVSERLHDIGVRFAMGASRANILRLVVQQGIVLTAIGAAIGMIGALMASRALISLLFGISRLDALTYIGVVGLIFSVSALACIVPALRAAQVDPAVTLRSE
ncbi:MAG TPA: ABC transporter permease [Terriglobales bacterium]|nr:ABC transporter permease [Terriglobales bacterium]